MKYPTLEAVQQAADANDFECLKTWHNDLPLARSGEEHAKIFFIEQSLLLMKKIDIEQCSEQHSQPLFDEGGEA